MSSRRSKTLLAAVATAVVVLGAGCAKGDEGKQGPPKPGALLSDAPLLLVGDSAELDDKAQIHSVTYVSTSGISGSVVEVSGMVLIPKGKPQPPAGYPLVSYGHGAVGFASACGPTSTKNLGPDDTPRVAALLDAGYVVAVADYQGLGADAGAGKTEAFPFREPKTVGYNLIDAARAAKALVARLGTDKPSGAWAAYGESQGGQAAWAAGDLAASYGSRPDGDRLDLVGVAVEKPPTDFTWLVDGASAGTLTPGDQISYLRLLKGLQIAHPELQLAQFVSGPLADKANQDSVFACYGTKDDQIRSLVQSLAPGDTTPAEPAAADRLKEWLADWKLPLAGMHGPPTPFFVAASTEDEVVPVDTVRAALRGEKAARLSPIRAVVKAGGKHREFDDSDEEIAWLADRFAGRPAPDD